MSGGALFQQSDRLQAEGDDPSTWSLVAGSAADEKTLQDLAFAWRALRSAKSNAILLADDGAAVGIGMGQVNRVDSCKLSVERANSLGQDGQERARGAVAASDAFFPFADGLEVLLESGVRLRYIWKNPNTGVAEEILIECTETRDQPKNKERALARLRTFIYDKEHQKYIDDIASKRKTMVSTGDRSAKIRTYNYPQGRITDHRINYTIYNLAAFMDGDIQDCIDHLIVAENAERLKESEL